MNRAMFSGVAGLKTHQTKMDVIGNNISNVNILTALKASVQSSAISSIRPCAPLLPAPHPAAVPNPSTVGYGSQLLAVQSQMTQSSMQSTGFGLDVAITGEVTCKSWTLTAISSTPRPVCSTTIPTAISPT